MSASTKYCFALDLKNDPQLIEAYKLHHKAVWPEVLQSIRAAGINSLEIYLVANRLFMIMTVDASFSFARKNALDAANPNVQQWEELMWKYQQALPTARSGEKWTLMEKIFEL